MGGPFFLVWHFPTPVQPTVQHGAVKLLGEGGYKLFSMYILWPATDKLTDVLMY